MWSVLWFTGKRAGLKEEWRGKMFVTPTVRFEGVVYYQSECRNFCWFGAGMGAFSMAGLGFMAFMGEDVLFYCILAIISTIVMAALAVGYTRYKIVLKDTYLLATPMLGREKMVLYDEITQIRYGWGPAKTLILMAGDQKLISIENYAVGYRELRNMFRENGML